MTTGITFRNARIEVSIDGGVNWTNISGQTNSLTVGGGDLEIGMFFDAASDIPTLGVGKRAELELMVRVKYTETDTEAQGILASAYENQTEIIVRYSPKGAAIGDRMYTTTAGFVKTNPYPGQEVESGDPLRLEFTIVIPSLADALQTYVEAVKALFGSSMIGYWPMWESSGTTIEDESGNSHTGTYTSATVASATSPGDNPCPAFNGTATIANVYSAGLASAFDDQEGSLAVWVKATAQSNWTDANARTIAVFQVDSNNQIDILKNAASSLRMRYTAGATISGTQLLLIAPTSWAHIAITWSKSGDSVSLYYNGVLQYSFTGLGVWVGALASAGARFGANATPSQYWAGWMADAILLDRPMTAAEVATLAFTAPNQTMPKITYIGDSITADGNDVWVDYVQNNYNSGSSAKINHAVGGASIIADMDGQVTAAVSDDADIIIVTLGTNDNDAGDMTALQAEVEENIAELRASNTGATIYYMNVLPKWTDSTGSTVTDRSHIRAAIAAACTAQGITCWDTFTSPWITAAQTSDGTHPTSAGHQAIATEVLARL